MVAVNQFGEIHSPYDQTVRVNKDLLVAPVVSHVVTAKISFRDRSGTCNVSKIRGESSRPWHAVDDVGQSELDEKS